MLKFFLLFIQKFKQFLLVFFPGNSSETHQEIFPEVLCRISTRFYIIVSTLVLEFLKNFLLCFLKELLLGVLQELLLSFTKLFLAKFLQKYLRFFRKRNSFKIIVWNPSRNSFWYSFRSFCWCSPGFLFGINFF